MQIPEFSWRHLKYYSTNKIDHVNSYKIMVSFEKYDPSMEI